jgi:hypothetical protein
MREGGQSGRKVFDWLPAADHQAAQELRMTPLTDGESGGRPVCFWKFTSKPHARMGGLYTLPVPGQLFVAYSLGNITTMEPL